MRQYQWRAALLWTVLTLAGLGLLAASFWLEPNQMPWAVGLFLIVCLAVQILLYRTAEEYMRKLVDQLSDLIDQLTQLREKPVFPPLEDTVLSRLQQQVERLSSIWAGQNQQAKRDRDEVQSLVSDLSHQLKTPVATLQIYSSLLSQPELSPEHRQEYGTRMRRALERLDFLLDSMVKLSRLESDFSPVPVTWRSWCSTPLSRCARRRKRKTLMSQSSRSRLLFPSAVTKNGRKKPCSTFWTTQSSILRTGD